MPNRSFYSIFFTPHGGRTRHLRGANLHGCAVGLQNRTRWHDAPHAAEQIAAPMCISDLCRSSAVSPPPTGGIGVRVLPASCVLVPKRYACAFLAQQEKPKTQPESPVTVSYTAYNLAFLHFEFRSRYISRYVNLKFRFLPCVVATIVATAAIQAALPGSRRFLAAVFISFAFSTRRFSPPNRIGAQISKILS